MSDLVTKVARAMIEGEDDSLSPTDKWRARQAIKAVAEWHVKNGGLRAAQMLLAQLKEGSE
jgi:hypothetical protein